MTVTERFLNYTAFDTQSSEESQSTPSTPGQMVFAQYLAEELKREGLHDVVLDDKGYVYATLPGNVTEDLPTIGFIAHYDTSPDCSGKGVKPRIVEHYDGGDIMLSEGIVLSPSVFPELLAHKGEDLIVTDGHTLLGADDKAGIAEIVQAMTWLRDHTEVKHGRVRIAFTPDEEIGRGADHFDVEGFGCQWAYTMDGGDVGELEYENFNAASAKVTVQGVSVHPGYAKGKMVNASLLAMEFETQLPADERPETTEGYEGFFHVTSINGSTSEACLSLIIRDHDRERFDKRKKLVADIATKMNSRYGEGTVTVEMHDQYYNMKEVVAGQQHIIDLALKAMRRAGVEPRVQPIRGGTDGAQLSFKGLPCPNIFAGGLNFHGPYEFIPVQSMEKAVRVIVGICQLLA
ncbi:MAG: peptidase T [Prevotella sp.]|nr:peptidase T [Prevotella sp.]